MRLSSKLLSQFLIVLISISVSYAHSYVGVEIYAEGTSQCDTEYYGIEVWITDTCIQTADEEYFQFSSSNNIITMLNCSDSECSNCTTTSVVQGTCENGVHDNANTTDKWMTWYDEPTFYIGPSFTVSFYDSGTKPCQGDPVGYSLYSSYTCNGGIYYECDSGYLAVYQCGDTVSCAYDCYKDATFGAGDCFFGVTNPYVSYVIDCSISSNLSFNWTILLAILYMLLNN